MSKYYRQINWMWNLFYEHMFEPAVHRLSKSQLISSNFDTHEHPDIANCLRDVKKKSLQLVFINIVPKSLKYVRDVLFFSHTQWISLIYMEHNDFVYIKNFTHLLKLFLKFAIYFHCYFWWVFPSFWQSTRDTWNGLQRRREKKKLRILI